MSKETFHHPTVPHYCPTDTPRPKRKGPRPLPEFISNEKARIMAARRYIWKWIRENWKEGDRFIVECPTKEELKELNQGKSPEDHSYLCIPDWVERNAGRMGTYKGMQAVGIVTQVIVELDPPPRKYDSRICSYVHFYHYVDKVKNA